MDPLIADYVADLDDGRRQAILTVDGLIRERLPTLEVKMWNKIIGYGQYHYVYASGREGDWFPVGLANQKAYISLYVCLVDGDQYLAEASKETLGKVSVGRSCIRFTRLDNLDLGGVGTMLNRVGDLLANDPSFGQ